MWFTKTPPSTPNSEETVTLPLAKFTALQLQVCDQQNHINALADQVAIQKTMISEQAATIESQAKTIETQKKAARSREASRDFVRKEEQEQSVKRKESEEWKNEREAWYRASHRPIEERPLSCFSFEGTEEVLSMRSEESKMPGGEETRSVETNLRDSGIDVGEAKVEKPMKPKAATFPRSEEPALKTTEQLNGDWDLPPDTLSNRWMGKKESPEKPTSASKKLKKKILKAATWK